MIFKKNLLFYAYIGLFMMMLYSCSAVGPEANGFEGTSSPTDEVEILVPYPVISGNGYPYPIEVTEPAIPDYLLTPVSIPDAPDDAGVVTGRIINLDTKEAVPFQTVYLGTKVFLTPAPGYTYHILENSSPHTITDINGTFVLENVQPADYIVMVWSPFGAYVIHDKNGELMVKAKAGDVLDLGDLEAIDPMKHTPSP